MAKYLLSVWHDDGYPDIAEAEMNEMFAAVGAFNDEVKQTGAWVFAGGLQHNSTATVVRADADADPVITDGPYAKTSTQMGGFWVIEACDLDAALEWARKGSHACRGPIEVRPFHDDE